MDQTVGSTCQTAILVTQGNYTHEATTQGASNDFGFESGACPGESSGLGGGSSDRVYAFKPPMSGNYTITLTSDFDSVLYAVGDCGNVNATCLGASDEVFVNKVETLTLYVSNKEPTYIIVDGYSGFSNIAGNYKLKIAPYSNPGCTPKCAGKTCGPDGCGAFCGSCTQPGTACDPTGTCSAEGTGESCLQPFVIPSLPFEATGDTTGASKLYAFGMGACPGADGAAGDGSSDHVYMFTPLKSGNVEFVLDSDFDSAIYLVSDCGAIDATCIQGAEEGGTWLDETMVAYLAAGETYFLIVDGYANFTNIDGGYTLTVKPYTNPGCAPACAGKTCGPDGCGGMCGICTNPGHVCTGVGTCAPAGTGESCQMPFEVKTVPFSASADTTGASNVMSYENDVCEGSDMKQGAGSSDHIYAFTPLQSTNYALVVDSDFDATLYLVTDCADVSGSCLAGSDAGASWVDEKIVAYLKAGETYYAIVDGYSNFSNIAGTYTLDIDVYSKPGCTPKCQGKSCGDDGCGGKCGVCGDLEACVADQCVDTSEGDTCAAAIIVGALPAMFQGDTSIANDDYHFKTGSCAGVFSGNGKGSKDHAYLFIPSQSASYVVTLDPEPGYDSALYIVSDCGDVNGTCLSADEGFGTEEIVLLMDAGIPYYIIVDGYGNTWDYSGAYTLTVEPL